MASLLHFTAEVSFYQLKWIVFCLQVFSSVVSGIGW